MPIPLRSLRPSIRTFGAALALIGAILVIGAAALWEGMRRSLPRRSGEVEIACIDADVRIGRDAWGRPKIVAASYLDATAALGFLHGQDRFFQMDMTRRYAAGTTAELLGPAMVSSDIESREFDPIRVATEAFNALPDRHKQLLRRYAEGVNAGLADLGAPPPEYLALAAAPEPWTEIDSMLVVLSMWRGLALFGNYETYRGAFDAVYPQEVVRFLHPETTRFDATIEDDAPFVPAPIPGPQLIDVRAMTADQSKAASDTAEIQTPGSNGWVVAGSRTADGRAILAADMHLGLMVPSQWYWAQLEWRDGPDHHRAVGVTLPGMPAVVVGSNGSIAWGCTNVSADVADWVVVEPVDSDQSRYRTPEGDAPFEVNAETIRVRFAPDRTIDMRDTRWGRVRRTDAEGRPMVLRWTGTDPSCIDLGLLDMMHARTVEEGLDIAAQWGGPPQNVMVAGADGHIGWTIAGRFPIRSGFDGRSSTSWATQGTGWTGFVPWKDKARVVDPPQGFIATANARTVHADRALVYGHNFSPSFRQHRIAEVLRASTHPIDPASTAELQNDTRLEMMDYWRDLVIAAAGDIPELAPAADAARAWDGYADVDVPGLVLIQRFRWRVSEALMDPVDRRARMKDGAQPTARAWLGYEEVLRRLLEDRPLHWLPAEYESWDALLTTCLRKELEANPTVVDRRYAIVARIRHVLSWATGGVLRQLDMPADRMRGHTWAVRVLAPSFGASQRLAIAPGAEDAAVVELPCGPSGHPMSRWYRSTHEAWVAGESIPAAVSGDRSEFRLVPTR